MKIRPFNQSTKSKENTYTCFLLRYRGDAIFGTIMGSCVAAANGEGYHRPLPETRYINQEEIPEDVYREFRDGKTTVKRNKDGITSAYYLIPHELLRCLETLAQSCKNRDVRCCGEEEEYYPLTPKGAKVLERCSAVLKKYPYELIEQESCLKFYFQGNPELLYFRYLVPFRRCAGYAVNLHLKKTNLINLIHETSTLEVRRIVKERFCRPNDIDYEVNVDGKDIYCPHAYMTYVYEFLKKEGIEEVNFVVTLEEHFDKGDNVITFT